MSGHQLFVRSCLRNDCGSHATQANNHGTSSARQYSSSSLILSSHSSSCTSGRGQRAPEVVASPWLMPLWEHRASLTGASRASQAARPTLSRRRQGRVTPRLKFMTVTMTAQNHSSIWDGKTHPKEKQPHFPAAQPRRLRARVLPAPGGRQEPGVFLPQLPGGV